MKNYVITVNGISYDVSVEEVNGGVAPQVTTSAPQPVQRAVPKAAPKAAATGGKPVVAPMPGKILTVKAQVGASVKKGDAILVLEAMKMENEIVASEDGTVKSIQVSVGDMVESGAVLATLE